MTNYLKDKRTFAEWLSRQTDLTLDAVWLGMQNNHRNQFMRRFAAYRSRAEMPEMDEMMQIIGEETTAMMRLAAAALPTASGAEKKQFVVEAVLNSLDSP
jgi:hypothetical protein